MANKNGHRRFGSIRKLPSGRLQVRYPGPDGTLRTAPQTFERKAEAERYLTLVEAQIVRQEWIDPDRGKVRLADYARQWIAQRPNLRPRTVHLYEYINRKHIEPYLGQCLVGSLTTPMVREWRSTLLDEGRSVTAAAKAYRLLRAMLNTAVNEDEIIRVNPCRLRGADQERPGERPVLTAAQVVTLSQRVPARYRALILVTAFGCLRWGEVAALHRCDVDLTAGTLHVRKAYTEQRGKGMVLGPPKSKAGRRFVSLPAAVVTVLSKHLDTNVMSAPDSLVFTTENGRPIWRGNFNKLVDWKRTVAAIGAPGLHFHDLRHTGNTLAARTGASLRDLMERMGHDSSRAALIYQHATPGADRAIAEALDATVADLLSPLGEANDMKERQEDS